MDFPQNPSSSFKKSTQEEDLEGRFKLKPKLQLNLKFRLKVKISS